MTDNELIAEFMGIREQQGFYDSYGQDEPYWYTSNGLFRTTSRSIPDVSFQEFLESCRYDLSWDWLMPACKKWDDLFQNDPVLTNRQTDEYAYYVDLCDDLDNAVGRYDIKPVFDQLVQNIKWYNSQKK